MTRSDTKTTNCKDRYFLADIGISKRNTLYRLCNTLDAKDIDYDTRKIARLSKKQARNIINELTSKQPKITQQMLNSFESRGKSGVVSLE